MKPILFNTAMVSAILAGRKNATRRLVKPQPETDDFIYKNQNCKKWFISPDNDCFPETEVKPPYRPGDILYVRETWQSKCGGGYLYKADIANSFDLFTTPDGHVVSTIPWRPSIHMPKEAARLFLRVTDVRVERLQDMQPYDIAFEGFRRQRDFMALWDSTIKKADLPRYGWGANPWVWVIEFERISKEEEQKGGEGNA